MKMSRSYSRPNASSSHFIERLRALHRPAAAILLAGLDVDAQHDVAPGHGAEVVSTQAEPAAHQREQVRGLRETDRARPRSDGPCRHLAGRDEVAVGEQHRRVRACSASMRVGVDRHHVRPVEEIGDAAEAFRLALRAVVRRSTDKGPELRIGGGIDPRFDFKPERPARRLDDRKPSGVARRCRAPAARCRSDGDE